MTDQGDPPNKRGGTTSAVKRLTDQIPWSSLIKAVAVIAAIAGAVAFYLWYYGNENFKASTSSF